MVAQCNALVGEALHVRMATAALILRWTRVVWEWSGRGPGVVWK